MASQTATSTSTSPTQTESSDQPKNYRSIIDRQTHDEAVTQAHTKPTPTLLFITSASNPSCITTKPKVLDLASKYEAKGLMVYEMELTADTTPMIKFGVWNCPIFVLIWGSRCETLLGWKGVEARIDRFF